MNEKDWKHLYDDLLQKHESEEAAGRELEELLSRTIVRLTLAAGGFDNRLDPHLKGVRDAIRNGVDYRLKDRLNALSDDLLHFADVTPGAADKAARDEYLHLLSPLKLSKKELNEAERLLQSLGEDPVSFDPDMFTHLLDLLGHGLPREKKTGLFDRLLGGGRAEGKGALKPNDILLNLLAQATWPGHWEERVNGFKQQLSADAPKDAWTSVLRELLELSAKSYDEIQSEIKEAESFLDELTQQLQNLGFHLQTAHDGRDVLVEHGRNLSERVNDHVGDLGDKVEQATDLHQLKGAITERLSLIKGSIDEYLKEELEWHKQADESEAALRDRLERLEKESYDLRSRMLEAHHLALQDTVTGLPNRLAYEERMEQEYARWKRFKEPLSMLVWDVDDFKSINDRFGHQAGDKALRVIAQSLSARLRETDFIARFGGEEFVCLLCGAEGEEALSVAEEMRKSVEDNGFHSAGKPVRVTISCGIACFQSDDTVDTVFSRADKALYAAKKAGKNRSHLSEIAAVL
ncbi:MAG: diguanylate cyclase [Candidatus Thiodiazotropha sp. (ex Notomyrtea botanica)]|nr:diguanylate cyclase [Candidatus Thiodiazotropha sp. (ex Notomyrtea botanica)]